MAKVGYIFKADRYDGFEADKEWMQEYGCVQVIEEPVESEALRPKWKQLVAGLERGDEVVVAKFSNALRGSRELSAFIELCRIKVVRIISIHDRIDSRGKLFPETTVADVLEMFGALPEEVAILRYSSARVLNLQQKAKIPKKTMKAMDKADKENTIVDMYVNGHSFEDIMAVSGYSSRSSVFSVLHRHGVKTQQGKFSGLGNPEKEKGRQSGGRITRKTKRVAATTAYKRFNCRKTRLKRIRTLGNKQQMFNLLIQIK